MDAPSTSNLAYLIEKQWSALETSLNNQRDDLLTSRLIPVFAAAKQITVLRRLYPYTALKELHFSNTSYPFSGNYPWIVTIPDVSQQANLAIHKTLATMNHQHLDQNRNVLSQNLITTLQHLINDIHYSPEQFPVFMQGNEMGQLIQIDDTIGAIDWILEESQGYYKVGQQLAKGTIWLGTGNIETTLKILLAHL